MIDKIQKIEIEKLSFEEALKELEDIVRELESGTGALDDAIDAYSRGAKLKVHCENKLKDAQTRIEKIVVEADGNLISEPMKFEK